MTATLGAAALVTALAASVLATLASTVGHLRRQRALLAAGRRGIDAVAALTTVAVAALLYALVTNDFAIAHVSSVSSRNMQTAMKWASLYSGQPGSLLFWTWTLSLFLAAFTRITVPRIPWAAPHAVATAGVILAAFLAGLVFLASPFRLNEVPPLDGRGLNPLLVDPGMLIHPPFLLAGLVSTAVPFTLGTAALLSGRLDGAWVRHARGWALASFLVLSIGNLLGAWWAYTVLGWGGYWGWDPVENSAILPLLPMTAFLHTLLVQERRGMLKTWNLVLVLAAFALAVFGTFNVRSGLVASVHSFAQSEVGAYFLALLAITIVVSVALIVWRVPRLHAEADLDALASRETALILNSYLFVAIALVILGGTLFPVLSELVRDVRVTVGPPFFNAVIAPLLVLLLVLIAAGTVLPWRGGSSRQHARRLRVPALVFAATAALVGALGMHEPLALAATSAAATIGYVTAREVAVGARGLRAARAVSWPAALLGLLERDPRRYGGFLVHLGVAIIAVAVVGSMGYQQQTRARIAPGESFEAGGYTFRYVDLVARRPGVNGIEVEGLTIIDVERDGRRVATLRPGRRFFSNFPEQPIAIVAVDSDLRRDVYLFVQGWDAQKRAEIQVFINPLVAWLWIGGGVYTLGGLLAFGAVGRREPVRALDAAPGAASAGGPA
ncbi:MAG: heme lyase CcmF/NrfE family subunit [Dehalococcoidia bacterium]|nr:heme lyase CcmF/NrfE family subunit [Dehalococcoidia bacterium]